MTQQQVNWPPGTRLRCVETDFNQLVVGYEYAVRDAYDTHVQVTGCRTYYRRSRFKPVVRVKMGRREVHNDDTLFLFVPVENWRKVFAS